MISRFLKILILYPKFFFLSTLTLCLVLGFFSFKLSIDASANNLLLEDDKDLKIFRELAKRYKNDDFLFIAFKSDDPFSSENLKELQNLHSQFEKVEGIQKVLSLINAPLLKSSDDKDLEQILKNIPSLLDGDINITKAKAEFLNSPFYKNNLISKDAKTSSLIIYLKPDTKYQELISLRDNAKEEDKDFYRQELKKHAQEYKKSNKKLLDELRAIIENFNKQSQNKLYLGGIAMIADDMISYVKADIIVYSLSLVLLLSLVLWVFFRKIRFIFLPLFICCMSLLSASGIFALLGFEITVISSNYVALQLIINIALIIHLITHFHELCANFPKASHKRLIFASLLAKFKPSCYASLTTAIGFLSLILSNINPIIELGIMMSIAIGISLVLSFIFFASILSLLKPNTKSPRKLDYHFLKFCATTSLKKSSLILIISLFILVSSFWGILELKVENSFVNYFKNGSDIKQGLVLIDKELGGTLPLDIIIKFKDTQDQNQSELEDDFEKEFQILAKQDTYWFSSKKIRLAREIHTYLENNAYIGTVLSLNSLLVLGKDINKGQDLDDFALAFLNENLPQEIKQELLDPFVNIPENELRFSMRIIDSDENLRRAEFLKQIKQDLEQMLQGEQAEVLLSGIMLLYNNMLQSLFDSQFNTLAFVVLSIFILFVLIFASFRLAFVALVANIIPLALIFGFMGFLGMALDFMNITVAAIAVGIGVDDSIHYIYRFKEELKHNKNIKKAIYNSHLSIGSAIYYTTIALVLGFAMMCSSNFIPTINFGLLTLSVMILMLVATLFLLPALLKSIFKIKEIK